MLVEKHHADETRNRRRDGVNGDQQRLVGGTAANDRIGLDRKQKTERQRKESNQHGEDNRELGDV
ncbi:hypothetical protein D3C87_1684560 [compost metagenome]